MPTTKIYIEDIYAEEITLTEFEEKIPYIGVEIDDIGEEYVKIEYTPNRPDFGFPSGIFKSLKGLLDREKGLIKYEKTEDEGRYEVIVSEDVLRLRPIIRCFVAKNLDLNDKTIEYLINFQEDLHRGIGRNRRKASIGLHDMSNLKFPIHYSTATPNEKFIPLGFEEELSIEKILERHPKGMEYGHLIPSKDAYPILKDSDGKILSLPPIINSTLTIVTERTRDLFIDVTGIDAKAVEETIELLATALADIGGEIYEASVTYRNEVYKSPKFSYRRIKVNHDYVTKILGLELSKDDILNALLKSRFDAQYAGGAYEVIIPPYRLDIMHPIDIVEDVAIGYGLWRIEPTLEDMFFSMGKPDEKEEFMDRVRETLVGMGMQEVVNHILVNKNLQEKLYGEDHGIITLSRVKTPRDSVRVLLTPGILENIKINQTVEHPVKIFEIGIVAEAVDEHIRERHNLAFAYSDYRATYADIKAYLDTLLELLGLRERVKIEKDTKKFLIRGRQGKIVIDDVEIGFIGEVDPHVLTEIQIDFPVAIAELDLDKVFNIYQGT